MTARLKQYNRRTIETNRARGGSCSVCGSGRCGCRGYKRWKFTIPYQRGHRWCHVRWGRFGPKDQFSCHRRYVMSQSGIFNILFQEFSPQRRVLVKRHLDAFLKIMVIHYGFGMLESSLLDLFSTALKYRRHALQISVDAMIFLAYFR